MAEYYCSNCREKLTNQQVKLMKIGKDRNLIFCSECNCYIKLDEPAAAKPVKKAE